MLGDRKMPVKPKIHRTVVRPALVQVAETWVTPQERRLEVNEMMMLRWMSGVTKRLEVNEMMMLRWMSGVTKKDKFANEPVSGSVKVALVAKKLGERRLMW